MKILSKKSIINSDSLVNDSQMALAEGLFKALKYSLKIHATSEESYNSLDFSRTCSITLDNPFIRALVKKYVYLIAENWCLDEGMNSL